MRSTTGPSAQSLRSGMCLAAREPTSYRYATRPDAPELKACDTSIKSSWRSMDEYVVAFQESLGHRLRRCSEFCFVCFCVPGLCVCLAFICFFAFRVRVFWRLRLCCVPDLHLLFIRGVALPQKLCIVFCIRHLLCVVSFLYYFCIRRLLYIFVLHACLLLANTKTIQAPNARSCSAKNASSK